eukprot:5233209-Karenia_brevis.AAC.1
MAEEPIHIHKISNTSRPIHSSVFQQSSIGGRVSQLRRQVAGSNSACDTNIGRVDSKGISTGDTQSQRMSSSCASAHRAAPTFCLFNADSGTLV